MRQMFWRNRYHVLSRVASGHADLQRDTHSRRQWKQHCWMNLKIDNLEHVALVAIIWATSSDHCHGITIHVEIGELSKYFVDKYICVIKGMIQKQGTQECTCMQFCGNRFRMLWRILTHSLHMC